MAEEKKEPVTIKKYANRRLYNTGTSAYVTLEDLAAMVKAGEDFVVYDAKTGDDITRSVLAQIIFEQENKEGQSLLPIAFLRQLIRYYGDSMQMLVPRFLEASIESLTKEQDKFREQMAQAFGVSGFGPLEEQVRRNRLLQDRLREQQKRTAVIEERQRLARELHDSVTQSLYSVTLYAEAAARLLQSGQSSEAAGHLRELGTTAREALREMRLLIFELSPPALEAGTLAEALQIRLDAVEARGGLAVNFRVEGTERLAPRTRREMYQIAQEALNNALKHSKAQSVRISLYHGDGMSRLEITDDGVGFLMEEAQKSGGAGLRGMRERVDRIGGTLSVQSDPGSGTKVTVTAPAGRQEGPESG